MAETKQYIDDEQQAIEDLRHAAGVLYLLGYTSNEVRSFTRVHECLDGEDSILAMRAQWERKERLSKVQQ